MEADEFQRKKALEKYEEELRKEAEQTDIRLRGASRFFSSLVDQVEAFAKSRYFEVQRYPKASSQWSLICRHPKGGLIHFILGFEGGDRLSISAIWQISEFETCRQYTKYKALFNGEKNSLNIFEFMENSLKEVVCWEPKDWNAINEFPSWAKVKKDVWEKTNGDGLFRFPRRDDDKMSL